MTKYFTGLLFASLTFISCKKETDKYNPEPVNDYYPLQVGKYINYKLDSTVYINFGQKDTIIHYLAQDIVDAQITDNLGRPAYRVTRYLRKDTTQSWTPNNTFMVVPTRSSIEYVENNLRFLKLVSPIKQDFSWKGNSYIDTHSIDSDLKYLDDWDYIYDSVDAPLTINSLSFDTTIKVFQRNESLNLPVTSTTDIAGQDYSVEKYAKGVGLIYREFLHWEYQGCVCPEHGYKGYGIKLSITGHN